MNDNIDKCVVNCIRCVRGSHTLFRGFGLNVTDQVGRLRRAQIQQQISAYYPDITSLNVSQTEQNKYSVEIKGYLNET